MTEFLAMTGIRKTYPGVVALAGVDFDLRESEVHVILGENGAGKSTLIKVLGGVVQPDAGEIRIDGSPARITSAADAKARGIATIHQELALVPQLSVAENLLLGQLPRRFGIVDRRALMRQAEELLDRVGATVDPLRIVGTMGVAQQQMVEIAKALFGEVRVLIMDEPTASLSGQETERLFELVRELAGRGVGVIFISTTSKRSRRSVAGSPCSGTAPRSARCPPPRPAPNSSASWLAGPSTPSTHTSPGSPRSRCSRSST